MSLTLHTTAKQKTHADTYTRHDNCHVEDASGLHDWKYDEHSHGAFNSNKTAYCSRPDRQACGGGTGAPLDAALTAVHWQQEPTNQDPFPTVTCQFSTERMFQDPAIVDAYYDRFGMGADPAFRPRAVSYCSQVTDGVPRMFAATADGAVCRKMFTADTDDARLDYANIASTVCSDPKNAGLPHCGCVNREQSETYRAIKPAMPFPDECFYAPCADGGTHFLPSEMRVAGGRKCPTTICGNLIGAISNNTISDSSAQQHQQQQIR